MFRRLLRSITLALLLSLIVCVAASSADLMYPPAPHDNTTDTYFGTQVADPYRPLESLDSSGTRKWIDAEVALTNSYLAGIPDRVRILGSLRRSENYEKISTPWHEGRHYFYTYNSGLQNQSVYYTMVGAHGKPRVLLDPNLLSADGSTYVGIQPSPDGKYIAYSENAAGFSWQTWHVREVDSGSDLPDALSWSKLGGAVWKSDDSGFYYSRYAPPKAGLHGEASISDQKIYFHQLGTAQSADRLVYQDPQHVDYIYGLSRTDDGRYLVLTQATGTDIKDRVYYADANAAVPQFKPLLRKLDASYNFVDNDGPIFYFHTTLGAPNWRVIAIDSRSPSAVRTIVPESADTLAGVTSAYHHLFLNYNHDVHTVIKEYAYDGKLIRDVALPGTGTAFFSGAHRQDRIVYYAYESYTSPPVNYAYDVATGISTVYSRPKINFDSAQYVTDEVFYRSKDGTPVPLFISYRKGVKRDGSNPTILYGYGGFDITINPAFSDDVATWLKMGGIYAVANIRGGSEYGEAWHKAGMVLTKQNVFDDFIAAAEYLIQQKYTSSAQLVAKGESNGGLLAAAVEVQRPDLWGAVLPGVGVLDMLRYHLWTDGKWWVPDYGCSTCSEDQFKALYAYSPYHNIKPNTVYPPTMVMASDHDDHVFTGHSLKFAARLQAAQAGSAPILLRLNTNSGHGASNLTKSLEETADAYAFLVKNLRMTLPSSF